MDQQRFWELLDQTLDVPLDNRVERLELLLTAYAGTDIIDFADHLAEALHALDTPAHSAAVDDAHGDAFLYIRCVALLFGSEQYRHILEHPQLLGPLGSAEAEDLIFVAPNIYEQVTGAAWEHVTPVNFESGHNPAWDPSRHAGDSNSSADTSWLYFSMGFGLHVNVTPEYTITSVRLEEAMNNDEQWQNWWSSTNTERAEAILHIDPTERESATVRKGRQIVKIVVSRGRSGFDSPSGASQPEQARDDIRAILDIARARLDLPPLPEFPPMPTFSDNDLKDYGG